MSLIIQDNAGTVADVNSYVDTVYCDTYLSSIGKDAIWSTKTTLEKETALINAFNYLDNAYTYKGLATTIESKFPRLSLVVDGLPITGMPTAVKKAQCELAFVFVSQGSLDTNINYSTGDTRTIIEESKDIAGAIKKTTKYSTDGTSSKDYKYYHSVDKFLNGYVSSLGNTATDSSALGTARSIDITRGV